MARRKETLVHHGKTYHLFALDETKRGAAYQVSRLHKNGYMGFAVDGGVTSLGPFSPPVKTWLIYAYPKPPKWYSYMYLSKLKSKKSGR